MKGGPLAKMKMPFLFGVGGALGDGRQYFSWVSEEDVVGAFLFALDQPDLSGVFNLVAPRAVRNSEMTKVLGRVMRRPSFMKVPRFAIKGLMGEQGAIVLESIRVEPKALLAAGYRFRHPELEPALRDLLGRG